MGRVENWWEGCHWSFLQSSGQLHKMVQVLGQACGMDKVMQTFFWLILSLCMVSSCGLLYLFTNMIYFFLDSLEAVNKNRKIILVALYFLIWGEAANVRFLPECLCYIFHNVSPILSQVLLFLLCSFRELHLRITLVWPIPYVDDLVSSMRMAGMVKCSKHLC